MRILIRKDALQIMSREIPASAGYSSYQFKFREMIGKLVGTWVEVETDYLFNNQFNTVPLEGITKTGLRVMENIVEAVANDERVGKVRCRYCGKMSSIDNKVCPHCEKSEYLYRTDINNKMPLVIRYRNCDDDINTINCTKWDEFINIVDSKELLKESELLEVRRYGHKIYKEVKTIGELYKIRKEEV